MIILKNKKAYFDYEILEEFEAGIILEGWEVKSIREGMANLKDSFIKIFNGRASLVDMHVARWKTMSTAIPIDHTRERILLLKKNELEKLEQIRKNAGMTIIPLNIHLKNGKIKLKIGAARGKRKYDKREVVKKREFERDIRRKGERW